LLNDCHLVYSLAPIFSFIGPASPIRLDDESVIRLATDADFAEITMRAPGIMNGMDQVKWIVETESRISGATGVGVPSDLERLEDILTAIRLTVDGGAHCKFLFATRKGDLSAASAALLPSTQVGSPSEITSEKSVTSLVDLFKNLRSKKPLALGFALRRFNQAFERTQIEDRLVDLVIVLESLLVRDGNQGEVAYKFRMRTAAMLGDGESLGVCPRIHL